MKNMKNLIISATTNSLIDWDIEEIISNQPLTDSIRIAEYQWDNTVGMCCDGLTYYQIEELNRIQGY